jgi:hypothetical protein
LNFDIEVKTTSEESTKVANRIPKPSIIKAVKIFSYEIGVKAELSHVATRYSE